MLFLLSFIIWIQAFSNLTSNLNYVVYLLMLHNGVKNHCFTPVSSVALVTFRFILEGTVSAGNTFCFTIKISGLTMERSNVIQ